MCLVILPLFLLPPSVLADPKYASLANPSDTSKIDFEKAVQMALSGSPYFTKSALEIDVGKLGESDSRFSLIPYITLHTTYYLDTYNNNSDSKKYQIHFSSNSYNPVISYFSIQASEMITQMAVYGHMTAIAEGIHQIAIKFIEIEYLEGLAAYQDEILVLLSKKLKLAHKQKDLGEISAMELQIVQQESALAQAEKEAFLSARKLALDGLASLLGLDCLKRQDLDLLRAKCQILAEFVPEEATLAQACTNSFGLKIQDLKEQLQEKNITLAYAQFMPTLSLGFRTEDPTQTTNDQDDVYMSVNIDIPIWQGMKRVNNVSRQKLVLRQVKAETAVKKEELAAKWSATREKWKQTVTAVQLTRSAMELARLKVRKSELIYEADEINLAQLLDEKKEYLMMGKRNLEKTRENELAVLSLRHLTGWLFHNYINVAFGEESSP